jgi:hypothetical protein
MKDFKRALYGAASLCAVMLVGLYATHLISGETLALFGVLLGLSLNIAVIVGNSNTPQKSVASMLRDDAETPRSSK